MKNRTLVKYDYESMPKDWKEKNKNPFKDVTLIYLGEIPNMEGHCYLQNINTGLPAILHVGNIIALTEEDF